MLRNALRRPGIAIVTVTLLAAVLRLWGLGHPPVRVFDEVYYPKSACWLLGWSDERCGIDETGLGDWVHPPLGKYSIALGELALDFDATDGLSERDTLSFRLPSAVAGTLTVSLVAYSAWLLFGAVTWTWLAGALLAVEGMSVVHSRLGMLDAFVTFWISLAFVCFLLDRRWVAARTTDEPTRLWSRLRPWRLGTALALGAGFATKWSALMALAVLAAADLVLDFVRRREAAAEGRTRGALLGDLAAAGFVWLFVPIACYLISYTAFFMSSGSSLDSFIGMQTAMAGFHATNDAASCLRDSDTFTCIGLPSPAWQWFLLSKVIVYWSDSSPGFRSLVVANGNVAVFRGALIALPLALYLGFRRRDAAAALISAMALGLYLPWFFVSRLQYPFYAVPIVPFLVLAFIVLVRYAAGRGHKTLARVLSIYALALGVVLWPIYAARTLSDSGWNWRRPFLTGVWGGPSELS